MKTLSTLLLALALVACGGGGSDTDAPAAGGIDTTPLAPGATGGPAADTTAAIDTAGPVVTHVATVATDSGEIVIELFGKDAPKAVKNFVGLAKKGFYNGIGFHRVAPSFVIQAGDPYSKDTTKRALWGQGGESIYGGAFEDELDPTTPSGRMGYRAGTVAMANKGPNTNSSQFFIVLSDERARDLKYDYTIFGRVRSGDETIMKIETTGLQGELVRDPIRIRKVSIREVGA